MNHGLFTFAETTRDAYDRHIELITRAEQWLDDHARRERRPATSRCPPRRLPPLSPS